MKNVEGHGSKKKMKHLKTGILTNKKIHLKIQKKL